MKIRLITNFILFQVGWFACVLGSSFEMPWLGPITVGLILAYHFKSASHARPEISLVVIAMLIGLVWDSLLVATGLLVYNNGMVHESLAPHWIIAMWALFASTLNVSMKWLKGRYALAFVFGAVGGPLSYYAGLKLGAVLMPSAPIALLVLGIGWAMIMPVLMMLSDRFNGFSQYNEFSTQGGN